MPSARATVTMLRVLMIVAGLLGSAAFVAGLLSEIPPVWVLLLNVPAVLLSIILLYFGVTLQTQLRRRPSAVVNVFIAAMIIYGGYALSETVWNLTHGHFPIPRSLISLVVAWFLYTQSKRLVREQRGASTVSS